ncbi:hypothetical protein CVU82_03490 [Candidatus Falkowbacteria bacterium HGW-Falkowbacteria-1]|jgi:hypothetical protein|uniref:Uncharacterized protein n=1 Tax=Candidatus Falkowbacteria bacterium HGW-Falkowbacteria-1 TaxID=2013768 RepID=A0A2N2E8N0_9BACT|nr:MAG: hypothetical protein CVU82_03490 [Candidatus Falkowbacteria bacterium HGW-Falkowbacteria-1]
MTNDNNKNKYREYFDNEKFDENLYYQQGQISPLASLGRDDKGEGGGSFSFKKIDKERKIALGVLGVFSLLIITIAFLNIKSLIQSPFVLRDPNAGKNVAATSNNTDNSTCSSGNCSAESGLTAENMDLKLVDTDGDSISDWDELFIYGTSPYLEDTDGDNLTDYEEASVYKTDPLCPEGQNCSSSGMISSQESENTTNPLLDSNGNSDILNVLNSGSGSSTDNSSISQSYQISPDEIRTELRKAGFSDDDLNLLSDDDLLGVYYELLNEAYSDISQNN